MTDKKSEAVRLVFEAIIESVGAAGPDGVPAGHLYAALMPTGISLEQFESFVSAAVSLGKIRCLPSHILVAVRP